MAKTKFTKDDIRRACAGVREAGIDVAAIEMRPDGSILVTAAGIRNATVDEPKELRRLI
jgi:hypothetical protein